MADSAGAKNERDVVGDATFPAAGWATNATYMFIRLRLDGTPLATGGGAPLQPFGWGLGIDTDGVLSNGYEYTVVVNGINETVKLFRAGVELAAWTPTVALPGFAKVTMPTGDGSKFSATDDGYLEFAVPLADLVALTKNDPKPIKLGKVTMWVATSANGVALDKDYMC